jgi:Raf kinase inhibitor-like YbhB/YbcL family protein
MLDLSSPAFQPNNPIPMKYTCEGDGVSPPLAWSPVPAKAKSIAILVDDPDAPKGPFLHWLVTDLPPSMQRLDEGTALPHDASVAESDAGTASYYGPCPASGKHRYRFHVYALDTVLGSRPEGREEFLSAIEGHIVDEGELVGTYEREARSKRS